MKRFAFTVVIALSAIAATSAVLNAAGGEKVDASKALCPVAGEPIDFFTSTDTADGPVYFCCKGCIKKYNDNPAKYAKETAAQRAILAKLPKIQTNCPVSGKELDSEEPGATATFHGEKIGFCCPMCVKKFKANPSSFKAKLAASYTYQTKCPVMGGEIDPSVYTTLSNGKKIYFCCGGCEKKLRANPSKYNDSLVAQGILVDWEKEKK